MKLLLRLLWGMVFFLCSLRQVQAQQAYFVDCNGNDANSGISETAAWKSVAKVNSFTFYPGDTINFKRGYSWTHQSAKVFLDAKWIGTQSAPIRIGSYGNGNAPVMVSDAKATSQDQTTIKISGSYIIVEGIQIKIINPYLEPNCLTKDGAPQPLGWYDGIEISGVHNQVIGNDIQGGSVGIFLTDSSRDNRVIRNSIHNLGALWRLDKVNGAMGALGVNIHGDDNEIGYNYLTQNAAYCEFIDDHNQQHYSAPFEIYNANRSLIHHNQAYGHRKHAEFGKENGVTGKTWTCDDNVLAYNVFASDQANAVGPNIHSGAQFGPVNRTLVYNNTFVFTGAGTQGIVASNGVTAINNIFIATLKAAYYANNVTEHHNIYWDYSDNNAFVQFATTSAQQKMGSGSIKADPLFDNRLANDYHLQSNSLGVDKGAVITTTNQLLLSVLGKDIDNQDAPINGVFDIGSDEYEDDLVDFNDLIEVIQNFGRQVCAILGDVDGNCKVDIFDFNKLVGLI